MNQQTTTSPSFTSNSSAPSNSSPVVTSEPRPLAPPDVSMPKAGNPRPQSLAKAHAAKATAAGVVAKCDNRCRHYTAAGRRCRLAALDPASGLCFRHVGRQFQPSDEDLSAAFVGLFSGFESAARIHDFLTQVTVLLVQNRVSTRRAAVLTYLGQTLLRTLPAIEQELHSSDQKTEWIFDLPRPKRDDVVSPERAFVNRMSELHERCKTPVADDGYDGWSSDLEKSK